MIGWLLGLQVAKPKNDFAEDDNGNRFATSDKSCVYRELSFGHKRSI